MAFTPQTSFVDKELASFYGDLGGAPTYYNMQKWDSYLSSNEDGISSVNDLTAENGPYLVLTASNYEDDSTIELAQYVTSLKKIMPDISNKADKSTTLQGYGIEDAYTKTEVDDTINDIKDVLPIAFNFPLIYLDDKVYAKEEILGWFNVTTDEELKQLIVKLKPAFLQTGIQLTGNPAYYKMPIQYIAYESKTQLKMVVTGLNTSNDVVSKYEILINLDGTILKGNSNIQVTVTDLEQVYHVSTEAPENTKLLWLDSTNNQIKYYDGSDWQVFSLGA